MTDIYEQIQAEIRETLRYFDINGKVGEDISAAATKRIRRLLKGNAIYFRKRSPEERQLRYARIVEAHQNGVYLKDICHRFGISKTQLCQILLKHKRKIRALRAVLQTKA